MTDPLPPRAAPATETRPWGALPAIDPDPDSPMCGAVNGKILCCRSRWHAGRHATPFPSLRRHGPVWVYWIEGGPFGTCHDSDPATSLYCGLEKGHEGDHLSPSNQGPGATLAEWPASPVPAPTDRGLAILREMAGAPPVEGRDYTVMPVPAPSPREATTCPECGARANGLGTSEIRVPPDTATGTVLPPVRRTHALCPQGHQWFVPDGTTLTFPHPAPAPPRPDEPAPVRCARCGTPVDGVLSSTMPVLCGCDEPPAASAPPPRAEESARAEIVKAVNAFANACYRVAEHPGTAATDHLATTRAALLAAFERAVAEIAAIAERRIAEHSRLVSDAQDRRHEAQVQVVRLEAERDALARALSAPPPGDAEEIERLTKAKDGAYRERDQVVALAARMAAILHWPTWLGRHEDKPGDPPWEDDWRNIVFIDLPSGQVSWHIHDSEVPLFRFLPGPLSSVAAPWDGHDTAEKYRRCQAPWPWPDKPYAAPPPGEERLREAHRALWWMHAWMRYTAGQRDRAPRYVAWVPTGWARWQKAEARYRAALREDGKGTR